MALDFGTDEQLTSIYFIRYWSGQLAGIVRTPGNTRGSARTPDMASRQSWTSPPGYDAHYRAGAGQCPGSIDTARRALI